MLIHFVTRPGTIFPATETHPEAPTKYDSITKSSEPQKTWKAPSLCLTKSLAFRISPLDSLICVTFSHSFQYGALALYSYQHQK